MLGRTGRWVKNVASARKSQLIMTFNRQRSSSLSTTGMRSHFEKIFILIECVSDSAEKVHRKAAKSLSAFSCKAYTVTNKFKTENK